MAPTALLRIERVGNSGRFRMAEQSHQENEKVNFDGIRTYFDKC